MPPTRFPDKLNSDADTVATSEREMLQRLTGESKSNQDTVRGGGEEGGHYLLRVIAISITIAIFLSAGAAIASAEADPDSHLYPIKRNLEDLKTWLASDPAAEAALEASHASARLDEIDAVVRAGKPEYVSSLLVSYDRHMENARRCITEASANAVNTSDLEAKLRAIDDQHDVLIITHADQIQALVPEAVEIAFQNCAFRQFHDDDADYKTIQDLDSQATGSQAGTAAGDREEAQAGSAAAGAGGLTDIYAGARSSNQGHANGSMGTPGPGQGGGNPGQGNGNGNNGTPGQGNGNGNGGSSHLPGGGNPGQSRGPAGGAANPGNGNGAGPA